MKPTHVHDSSHVHFLTFSCYRKKRLFHHNDLYLLFLEQLERTRLHHNSEVWAYVVMPDHVHLLLWLPKKSTVPSFLRMLKRGTSVKALDWFESHQNQIVDKLTVWEGRRSTRHFWQRGGGYDRNLYTDEKVRRTIEYIHGNPVRAGLAVAPIDWRWSSARFYEQSVVDLVTVQRPFSWR